jgi:hypothetical protein
MTPLKPMTTWKQDDAMIAPWICEGKCPLENAQDLDTSLSHAYLPDFFVLWSSSIDHPGVIG